MKKIRPSKKLLVMLEEGYKAIKPMKGWMQGSEAECDFTEDGKRLQCRYCAIGSVYFDTKTQEHRVGKDNIRAGKAVQLLDLTAIALYPQYESVVGLNDDSPAKTAHRCVLKVFRKTIAQVKEQLGIAP